MAFKDWKLGTSLATAADGTPETVTSFLRQCADEGVTHLEISGKIHLFDLIARKAKELGLTLWSLHLPFSHILDISQADDELREKTLATHESLMRLAASYGVQVIVVHPSAEPIDDAQRPLRMANSHAGLLRLAKAAKALGMRLAVEDLPRTCLGHNAAEMLALLEGNDDLSICFDANHLLIERNEDFLAAVGERVITLHISDYDFVDERHLLPGDGDNDWKAIIALLEAKGYEGPWMHEVSALPKNRTEYVLPADLRRATEKLAAL